MFTITVCNHQLRKQDIRAFQSNMGKFRNFVVLVLVMLPCLIESRKTTRNHSHIVRKALYVGVWYSVSLLNRMMPDSPTISLNRRCTQMLTFCNAQNMTTLRFICLCPFSSILALKGRANTEDSVWWGREDWNTQSFLRPLVVWLSVHQCRWHCER